MSFSPRHASRCLPAFFALAHLFFIANASRFRPASLSLPRRERAGTAAVWAVLFAAQRLLVASMILLRPSGLRRLFFVLLSTTSGPVVGEPVISRSADIARSMADRCFSSLEMTFSTSFTQSPCLSRESTPIQAVGGRTHLRFHHTTCSKLTCRLMR
jgi:hypothetical protein